MSELDWLIEAAKIIIPAVIAYLAAKRKNEADAVKSLMEAAAGNLVEQYVSRNKFLQERVQELEERFTNAEVKLMKQSIGFQINSVLLKKCGVAPLVSTSDLDTLSYEDLKAMYLGISNS